MGGKNISVPVSALELTTGLTRRTRGRSQGSVRRTRRGKATQEVPAGRRHSQHCDEVAHIYGSRDAGGYDREPWRDLPLTPLPDHPPPLSPHSPAHSPSPPPPAHTLCPGHATRARFSEFGLKCAFRSMEKTWHHGQWEGFAMRVK